MRPTLPIRYPFDAFVSGTIWEGRLDEDNWGKGCGASEASDVIEDNVERVDCSSVRDKTSGLPQLYLIGKSTLTLLSAAIMRTLSVSMTEFSR
jgi:hypothetical protein